MATFQITSKLSKAERQRINRAAERGDKQPVYDGNFVHVGRNRYCPVVGGSVSDAHYAARRAMVVAGRTFEYDVH